MVLHPVLGKLVSKRVVLASASPRRQEILTNVVSAAGGRSPRTGPGLRAAAAARAARACEARHLPARPLHETSGRAARE